MKTGFVHLAATLTLLCAVEAAASVISASSQAMKSRDTGRADYLDVTTAQNDLNASLRDMTVAVAPAEYSPGPLKSSSGGGFVVQSAGSRPGYGGHSTGTLLGTGGAGGFARDSGGYALGRGNHQVPGGGNGKGKHGNNGRRGRGGDERRRDGVAAAPEPATWLTLAAGLALIGVTARRRHASAR